MDLFEYQGKQYFAKFNIPVSAGGVAHTVEEAVAEAEGAISSCRKSAGSSWWPWKSWWHQVGNKCRRSAFACRKYFGHGH